MDVIQDSKDAIAAVAAIEAVPTLLQVICGVTGLRVAAVARVTEEGWIACATRDEMGFGLGPGTKIPIEHTFCRRIRETREPVIFTDAARDPVYANDPIAQRFGLQSYISYPITLPGGAFFGTLCALDTRPRDALTPEITGLFRLFSDLIGFQIDAQARMDAADTRLREEQARAVLREEFVAVLSHDLRNPLASLSAGLRMLRRQTLDAQGEEILALMDNSVQRMSRLIADTTDFARVRLGGGMEIGAAPVPVAPVIRQAVEELALAHPGRTLRAEVAEAVLACDPPRIGQVVSNLVANALTHGAEGGAITLTAGPEGSHYVIRVANPGEPIPADVLPHIFQPFVHSGRGKRDGLGLGLFIADQIARAHRGTLSVQSDAAQTMFTLRLPV